MATQDIEQRLLDQLNPELIERWYTPMPGFYSIAKEDGETLPRRVRQTYFDVAEHRPGPIRFEDIPELEGMILSEARRIAVHHPDGRLPLPLALAYGHLQDAKNETLRRQDREMHFDIAGSEVWQYRTSAASSSGEVFTNRFMTTWRRANGV